MFTGLIQEIGVVDSAHLTPEGLRVSIVCSFATALTLGESVAVHGVCLTVSTIRDGVFVAVVVPSTLKATTLGSLARGSKVHLERALQVGDRLGGHFVLGHADGTGQVTECVKDTSGVRLRIRPPRGLIRFIAPKGSITVDGVSLTVSRLARGAFEVALVPHTLKSTTLGALDKGDCVNLEVDVLARTLDTLLASRSLPHS